GVVHDRVGVDRALPAHRLEFEIGRDAARARRVGRVLEMPAALAALQFERAAFGRFPERARPFVWHWDRPGRLAPLAHRPLPRSLTGAGSGMRGSSGLSPPARGTGAALASATATISRISLKAGGALRPNSKISRNVCGSFQIAASTTCRMLRLGWRIAHCTR